MMDCPEGKVIYALTNMLESDLDGDEKSLIGRNVPGARKGEEDYSEVSEDVRRMAIFIAMRNACDELVTAGSAAEPESPEAEVIRSAWQNVWDAFEDVHRVWRGRDGVIKARVIERVRAMMGDSDTRVRFITEYDLGVQDAAAGSMPKVVRVDDVVREVMQAHGGRLGREPTA